MVSVEVYHKDPQSKCKNRKLPCYFCGECVFNPERHMERIHDDEIEVRLAIKAREKDDGTPFQKLKSYGIFNHNVSVLRDKEGIFFVARSSDKQHCVEDYLPCCYCQGFIIKKELYRHCNRCKLRDDGGEHKYAADGRLLLDGALMVDSSLPKPLMKVLSNMRVDSLTRRVRGDPLILKFGASLIRKLGPKRGNDVSQRMRQLARIGVQLTNSSVDKALLEEYISGSRFDDLIQAVCTESSSYEDEAGRQLFRNPNLALKLGHSLLKLAKIKLGACIRSRNVTGKQEAEEYISLHNAEYTDIVATPAHASVKLMARKLDDFPDAADLLKLKEYQERMSASLCKSILQNASISEWRHLAEITMTRLIVYNARRGSEVADLRLKEYHARTNVAHSNVKGSMTKDELRALDK